MEVIQESNGPSQCWRCGTTKEPNWAFCPQCSVPLSVKKNFSPPNPVIDIPFLYNMYSFGWYNHHIGAVALHEVAASIDHFCDPRVPEGYRVEVEPAAAQQILRAKIYAEQIAQLEAFGILCLTLTNHKQQSLLWTYLNTEPYEVTQFYDRVLSFSKPPSLQKLFNFPQLSKVRKAIEAGVYKHFDGLPDIADQIPFDDVLYDYTQHSRNIMGIAEMYRKQEGKYVKVYNKIKHVFPIVQGINWLDFPLDKRYAHILLEDKGEIALLPMGSEEVEQEIAAVYQIMRTGAELMALYISLFRLDVL